MLSYEFVFTDFFLNLARSKGHLGVGFGSSTWWWLWQHLFLIHVNKLMNNHLGFPFYFHYYECFYVFLKGAMNYKL